jgi:prepilin-type N-terminal cleavage/methylation domain-containing protein
MARRRRGAQDGFTLLEMMVVVAIIAVLAKLALPSFAGQSRKSKGDAEVNAFFAELLVREEQYQVENGRYLSTGANESATFPATQQATAIAIGTLPAAWTTLKIRPPMDQVRCSYVVLAGTAGGSVGAMATSFGYASPQKNWFYAIAHCNLDNSSATDSYYFVSGDKSTVQKLNYGS